MGVWVEDSEYVWITAVVENDDFYDPAKKKGELVLRLENGQVRLFAFDRGEFCGSVLG